MAASSPIGTRVYYDAAGGASWTEIPLNIVSVEEEPDTIENVPEGGIASALRPTSPGSITLGSATIKCRCSGSIDADINFWQLVYGWFSARKQGISIRVVDPKADGDTIGPTNIRHGYVERSPVKPAPESGGQVFDIVMRWQDLATLADGA